MPGDALMDGHKRIVLVSGQAGFNEADNPGFSDTQELQEAEGTCSDQRCSVHVMVLLPTSPSAFPPEGQFVQRSVYTRAPRSSTITPCHYAPMVASRQLR